MGHKASSTNGHGELVAHGQMLEVAPHSRRNGHVLGQGLAHVVLCVQVVPWQDKGGENAPARANKLEVLAIRNQKL
jgi:hypothetical protein